MDTHYQKCIFSPLTDCIDINIQVPRVADQKLRDVDQGASSGGRTKSVGFRCKYLRIRFEGTDIIHHADIPPATIIFLELFRIERRASLNEKVPFSLTGHFKVINFDLQKVDSGFVSSILTSCCFYSQCYFSLILSR